MITILTLLLPVVFAVQSASFKLFGKKCDQSNGSKTLFTLLYLGVSSVLSLPLAFVFGAVNPMSILYGVAFGVLFYGFIRLYNAGMVKGPMSITSFVFSMSLLVPIVLSLFLLGEKLTLLHIIGVGLLILAAYFINFAGVRSKTLRFGKNWFLICAIGFVFNGLMLFCSKYFSSTVEGANSFQFLFVGFTTAFLISCCTLLKKGSVNEIKTAEMSKYGIIFAVIIAVTNIVGNAGITILSAKMSAGLFFPMWNGSALIYNIILSVLLFKEDLKGKAILGLIIGLIAIIVLNI